MHRARWLDHRRARRRHGQDEVHAPHVHRRRPGHDAARPVRLRPAGPVEPGQGLPDPAAVRRGDGQAQGGTPAAGGRARGGVLMSAPSDVLRPAADSDAIAGVPAGTVAASTSVPRRMLYGTVRDLLIGVTVVRPDGVVAHAGGNFVNNVDGYDLGKLVTGSFG